MAARAQLEPGRLRQLFFLGLPLWLQPVGPAGASPPQACSRGEPVGVNPPLSCSPHRPQTHTHLFLKESHCRCQSWTRTVKAFKSTSSHSSIFPCIGVKISHFFIKVENNNPEKLRTGQLLEPGRSQQCLKDGSKIVESFGQQAHGHAPHFLPPPPPPLPGPCCTKQSVFSQGPCAQGCPA